MTSGNKGDVKENTSRYVGVTDIKKECRILYLACAVLHAVMALCFMELKINVMTYESVAAAIFYLIGAMQIYNSRHTRRWIIMFVIEILLDAVLGQLVLGWGYGYILYGIMLIPIVYYFFYLDNQT